MKALTMYFSIILTVAIGFVLGCGNEYDDEPAAPDGDADVDPDAGPGEVDVDVTQCAEFPETTCAAKIAAGHSEDCVADFSLGTNQAGNAEYGYEAVGFYAYNDHTAGSTQIPIRNMDGTEPAAPMQSCDPNNDFVLQLQAEGFMTWGAGVGLDWPGPANADCDVEGALDCWQLFVEDDKFLVKTAEADSRCQDPNAAAKLSCLEKGKAIKTPRDLSDYSGIGFWVLATADNMMPSIKVTFPIPDTVRFYGECDDDDDNDANGCFNDYYTTVNLSPTDANKWVYKEVYFDDISWNTWWGLQLDELGYDQFPKDKSMGIKFQVDTQADTLIQYTDLYFDDITLVR